MMQQKKQRRKGGFTLVELVVTLVIMSILFAIAVPNLLGYIHLSQFRKNESYAKTMYLSAESALTYRRTGGSWEEFRRKVEKEGTLDQAYTGTDSRVGRIYGIRLDAGEYAAGDLTGDAALVDELLSIDTYDKSILNAAVCIEIDVTSGQVYSVFYGTACKGLYYESNNASKPAAASGTWLDMDKRDYDTRRAERLGYYSVDDVSNVVNLDTTRLKITSINLVNSETLSLNWSSNSKYSDNDVIYEIKLYNNTDKSLLMTLSVKRWDQTAANGTTASIRVRMAGDTAADDTLPTYTFPLEYDQLNKRFSLTLDAMMNAQLYDKLASLTAEQQDTFLRNSSTSITRFGGALASPINIYATIQAFPNPDELHSGEEYQQSTVVSSNTANTLFGDGTANDGSRCEIAVFRHLSNIRFKDSAGEFAVTARSLDWNSDSVKVYQTLTYGSMSAVSGAQIGFPSVPELRADQTIDGNSGILNRIGSIFTGGNAISNLKLDNTSIPESGEYLGLFRKNSGTINNLRLVDPQVGITSSTLKGVGAVCGYSSGSLQSSEVTGTDMTVDLSGSTNAQGIGGFVGVVNGTTDQNKVESLTVTGNIKGILPSGRAKSGIGGVAGSLTRGYRVAELKNQANVTGNHSVGGVAGYLRANGAGTGATVLKCENEGLILSSVQETDAANNYNGYYIGGIVGYAERVALGSCTSRAGYADGYQYTLADKSRLKGKYVGGIIGYADASGMYNCSTKANGYVLGSQFVGGIVGGTNKSDKTFLYEDNKVTVTTNASYVIGNSYIGGIIGINTGASKIENCVNTGVVAGYGRYIGGICGANMADSKGTPVIADCASYVSDTHNKIYQLVTGWGAAGSCAGGLTGYNSGEITFTQNAAVTTRSVAGIVVGKDYVGGLVGFNDAAGVIKVDYTLIGGRVWATGDCVGGLVGLNASTELLTQQLTIKPSSVQGRYYVGGAIGANVVNPTENVKMDGMTVNNSLGTISAEAFCGGLVGYQRTYTAANLGSGTLQQALDSGRLLPDIITTTGSDAKIVNVPAVVAASANPYTVTITSKDNTAAKLSHASNNMMIRAYAYAGGIVGYCETGTKMQVVNCLNAGGFDKPDSRTFAETTLSQGVNMVEYLKWQGYTAASAALQTELDHTGADMYVSVVGGVVGVNGANHVIDHCGSTGTMNGLTAMGGVVGLNEGLITKCTLSGSMGSATQDYIGGIAGLNVGSAENRTYGSGTSTVHYRTGTISGCITEANRTVTGRNTVGGIVGYNMGGGTVKDNQSNANVSGTSRIGGIAGENGGAIVLSNAETGHSRRVNGAAGGSGIGGVIGVNTAAGTLTADNTTAAEIVAADRNLTVQGAEKVGGIAGINRGVLGGTEGHYLTSQATVRASNGGAGGIVGAQEGAAATRLAWAKNYGQVTANAGAAGGIVGINGTADTASADKTVNTVENCIDLGGVTSNDGFAGGVVSENYGMIDRCTVGGDSGKTTLITRSQKKDVAAGAVCAINHAGAAVRDSSIGSAVAISGNASILGAVVGDNYGTVTYTAGTQSGQAVVIKNQPSYEVSASTLTVGGAVGRNSAGGVIENANVQTDFTQFDKFRYLGGVVGENCGEQVDETKPETDASRTTPAAAVQNCTYSGTMTEGKSAVGNCYGGIAGLNRGVLHSDTISKLTLTANGAYTATSTSSAADKERLSTHIGGIAGKNETTGTIEQCYIDNTDSNSSKITVQSGMVGGVTGYNKGTITMSGDKSTETLMKSSAEKSGAVEKISELLSNAKSLSADSTWVKWQDNRSVEELSYNGGATSGGQSTSVAVNRTMQIIVSSNGNLGGVAGYNAPSGALDHCVSGNWLLVNKSDSISVGTGGIVGMNESEKDLSYLLNRAFVGRQLKKANTSRFAGGIIGTQSNQTTNGWTITGCVNYGTVYGYLSHYSGGIVGQWTNNGGTIENCYNYGNLQTTMAIGWVGASGGIVAQLYHAASNQDFNIVSCQNHGNIYGRDGNGQNGSNKANDSAGILGNITAYRADNGGGQAYTINVVDCVNGPGVEIYSASMASGIVGFFSTDGIGSNDGNDTAGPKIGAATENIVLNIDRCRNYSQKLYGANFSSGIFGDRYIKTKNGSTKTVADNTYIQNCFSISDYNNNCEIISRGNSQGYSINDHLTHASNNYYFLEAWGMSGSGNVGINSWEWESRRAASRKLLFAQLNSSEVLAVRGGPDFADAMTAGNYKKYDHLTSSNTVVNANNDLLSTYNGTRDTVTGHVLFRLPGTKQNAYTNFLSDYSNQSTFRSAIYTKNGSLSDMDDYVQSYYREFEHDRSTLSGTAETENGKYRYKLDPSFTVQLDQTRDGSFEVAITDTDRPLYYEGEVLVDGKTVLSNLRFIPRENGQGVWKGTFDGKSTGYGSGVTTGTFQLPENLAASTAGRQVTLKVRAVSLFEDTAPSDEVSASTDNVAVLPQPNISIRLYMVQTNGWGTKGEYKVSLNNYADFDAFNNWKVTLRLGSQTKVIDRSNPTVIIDGENVKELIVTATADETNGIKPAAVMQTIPTDTPSSPYTPDGSIKSLDVSYSGNTVDNFTVTASLTVNQSTMETPPIYRIEVLGSIGTQEYVFAYEDVLTSAGNAATANFTNLPEQYFEKNVTNRRVRAWYAASGLGPVYTYGDTEMAVYSSGYHAEEALTYRSYVNGQAVDKTVYSFVVKQADHFGNYIRTSNLSFTPLEAPELNAPEKIVENGSLKYRFSWTQPREGTSTGHYTVKLTGITASGARIGIPTAEIYTNDTDKSFTVNADDWNYSQVELTVTRVGQRSGEVGLSATATYPVQQRLERPGQPSVSNEDTNELMYSIGWSAISDQTGCGQYRIYVQTQDGTAVPLGDPVAASSSAGTYSVKRDLEPYAGQTITLYLVAEADGSGRYANSPNGISYTMTVPERIGKPTVKWAFSWDGGKQDPIAAEKFRSGDLRVTVMPQDDASAPPGGSTYLLQATIIAPDGSEVHYPESGTAAMTASGEDYIYDLTELSTKYAGCKITFRARISQSAGQVSSEWVTSDTKTLPRVKLETPTASLGDDTQALKVLEGIMPAVKYMTEKTWQAQFTTLSWTGVENADWYEVKLTDRLGKTETAVETTVRINMTGDSPKIQVDRGNSWETIADKTDDWYTVKQGSTITANYNTSSGSTRYYQYALDTLLKVDGDTFTLRLPNVFSMVTQDQQTLQLGSVQTTGVTITAQSDDANRYVASDAAQRNFN